MLKNIVQHAFQINNKTCGMLRLGYQLVRVEVSAEQGRLAVDAGRVAKSLIGQVPQVDVVVPAAGNHLRPVLVVVQGPDPTLEQWKFKSGEIY